MARSQANLQFRIFRSLAGLSPEAKLLYVEILVDPTVNQAGVGTRRIGRWARELELDDAVVEKALDELDHGRFVLADPDTDEILVRTLIRNDGVADQPNVLRSALRAAVLCESPRLRRALAAELRRLPAAPAPVEMPQRKGERKPRVFRYPDPHAVADELDPPGPTTPVHEPFTEPSQNPSENHLRTISEPSEAEGFSEGSVEVEVEVEVVTSRRTQVPIAAAAATQARAHTRTREAPPVRRGAGRGGGEHVPPAELDRTAGSGSGYVLVTRWATTQRSRPTSGHRRKLVRAVDALLAQGADPNLVLDALDRAHGPRWRDPIGALPHAYEDVRRALHAPPPQQPRWTSTTDERVAQAQALKALFADEPPGTPPFPPLLMIEGGAA